MNSVSLLRRNPAAVTLDQRNPARARVRQGDRAVAVLADIQRLVKRHGKRGGPGSGERDAAVLPAHADERARSGFRLVAAGPVQKIERPLPLPVVQLVMRCVGQD